MPPRPHGHGDDDDEEEVIITPRTDGPPFVDIHAKQGRGFDVDYDTVQKYLGPGKLSLSDFMRDMDAINKAYIPSALKSGLYLRIGGACMMGGLVVFILMGIIGGTPAIRSVVLPISLVLFLVGILSFLYSKWVEQGSIRLGAAAVKKVIDGTVNPRYGTHPARVRYTISVSVRPSKSYHMGRTLLTRPTISIYCLRSLNADNVMTEWDLPEAILHAKLPPASASSSAGGSDAAAGVAPPAKLQ